MDNYEKRDRYALLNENLDKALKNEFYYEAIFIEHAILEDRIESLLRHAKIVYPGKILLGAKMNYVDNEDVFKDEYVLKHIDKSLMQEVRDWKKMRNDLVHDLVNCSYDDEDVKDVALVGKDVIRKFAGKSTLVNKYFDKIL